MQFKFTFKHMEALDSIEEYAKHRIEKINKYTMHKELKVYFIFEAQKQFQKAEVLITAGRVHMSASAREEDLYTAIDKAVTRIEKQLVKNKEKIQSHLHHHHERPDFSLHYEDIATPLTFDMVKKAN